MLTRIATNHWVYMFPSYGKLRQEFQSILQSLMCLFTHTSGLIIQVKHLNTAGNTDTISVETGFDATAFFLSIRQKPQNMASVLIASRKCLSEETWRRLSLDSLHLFSEQEGMA